MSEPTLENYKVWEKQHSEHLDDITAVASGYKTLDECRTRSEALDSVAQLRQAYNRVRTETR